MLQQMEISDFKVLRHVTAEFGRLTVIVGPNGCGKTSILDAIHFLSQTLVKPFDQFLNRLFVAQRDLRVLQRRRASKPLCWKATTSLGEIQFLGDFENLSKQASAHEAWTDMPQVRNHGELDWRAREEGAVAGVVRELKSTAFLRLNARRLATNSTSTQKRPRIKFDGYGLATVLAALKLNRPDLFDEFEHCVRQIIPSVLRIRFDREEIVRSEIERLEVSGVFVPHAVRRRVIADCLLIDSDSGDGIPASLASEGTLLTLGLLAVIFGESRPNLLLLDDCELCLHPMAQKRLIFVLRQLLSEFPTLQIIATSHSPVLLDWLEPAEVRLMTTDADGYGIIGRLEDHPDFDRWKDEMSPGELWSVFGEQWLRDGVASETAT